QAAHAVGDLVVNVGGGKHRMVQVAESLFVESAFNSTLAVGELLVYLGIHSKSLSVGVDDGVVTSSDAAESQRISSFFSYFPRRSAASSLDQGLAPTRTGWHLCRAGRARRTTSRPMRLSRRSGRLACRRTGCLGSRFWRGPLC